MFKTTQHESNSSRIFFSRNERFTTPSYRKIIKFWPRKLMTKLLPWSAWIGSSLVGFHNRSIIVLFKIQTQGWLFLIKTMIVRHTLDLSSGQLRVGSFEHFIIKRRSKLSFSFEAGNSRVICSESNSKRVTAVNVNNRACQHGNYALLYWKFPMMHNIQHSVEIWLVFQHSVKSTASWLVDIGK